MSQFRANTAVTLGLALVLSTLVGGTAAWFVTRGAALERSRNRDSTAPAAKLTERVAALEAQAEQLSREVSRLTQQQATERRLHGLAERFRQPASADENANGGRGEALARGEDPRFELAVRQVLDRVDWEREEEERLVSAQRQELRAKHQSQLLSERLQLAPPQQEQLAQVLAKQMQAFRELRNPPEGAERPATRSEWGKRMELIRDETDHALGGILSEEQLAEYRRFIEEEGTDVGLRGRSRPRSATAPALSTIE